MGNGKIALMNAALMIIGDEILIGQVRDMNSGYIADALVRVGVDLTKIITVGDEIDAIVDVLRDFSGEYDHVIITGGLGPTKDDITKNAFLKYFGGELILHQDLLQSLKDRFAERGWEFHDSNIGQAEYPDSCSIIPNGLGSAQGMHFQKEGSEFYSLPGVPHEMYKILDEWVIPHIRNKSKGQIIKYKTIGTVGIGETGIAEIVESYREKFDNLSIAYLPGYDGVRVRLTAKGTDESHVDDRLDESLRMLDSELSRYTYSTDGETLQEVVKKEMIGNKLTLSVAESCTGGMIQDIITLVPGASEYFLGGIVSYSNAVKISQLGVKRETLQKEGAVSPATVVEMAQGVRERFQSSIGLSITGIAGPGGGTKAKPVGLVYIGYSDSRESDSVKYQFGDTREINKKRSAGAALGFLWNKIKKAV